MASASRITCLFAMHASVSLAGFTAHLHVITILGNTITTSHAAAAVNYARLTPTIPHHIHSIQCTHEKTQRPAVMHLPHFLPPHLVHAYWFFW